MISAPFCMMPLAHHGSEWLNCLMMDFKGSHGDMPVPAYSMKIEGVAIIDLFGHAQPCTEEDPAKLDKEMPQRNFLDAGTNMACLLPESLQVDQVAFATVLCHRRKIFEIASYATVRVIPCCKCWYCMGLDAVTEI